MAKVDLAAWQVLRLAPDLEVGRKGLCQGGHKVCRVALVPTPKWLFRTCSALATPVLGVSTYRPQGVPSKCQWAQVVLVNMEDLHHSMVLAWAWAQVVSRGWGE